MKAYFAIGGIGLVLIGLIALQSHRLEKQTEARAKAEQSLEASLDAYDALKLSSDNQLSSRDNAIAAYRDSMTKAKGIQNKLTQAVKDAKQNDESFDKCMRMPWPDDAFNSLPR